MARPAFLTDCVADGVHEMGRFKVFLCKAGRQAFRELPVNGDVVDLREQGERTARLKALDSIGAVISNRFCEQNLFHDLILIFHTDYHALALKGFLS
jgi:hypothetical protein